MISAAATVAAADYGVRAAMPLDLLRTDEIPSFLVLLQTARDFPTSVCILLLKRRRN